jgi:molybdopterin synthase catalytic subunit
MVSATVRHVRVIETELSVDRLVSAVRGPQVGGIALFIGVVRDTDEGQNVVSLDYTQHPSAEQVLAAVAARVAELHDVV